MNDGRGSGLVVSNVTREFRLKSGQVRTAVSDVSLAVRAGEVVSILGPNGAGKTTLVKMISGMLDTTAGTIEIAGTDIAKNRKRAAHATGFALGGDTGLYLRVSALDNLVFFALMYGMRLRDARASARRSLDLVGLLDRRNDIVEKFSRGMKQRLHLARSIVHDPGFLVLDEPSSGLDPDSAERMRRLVDDLRGEGKAILLTTHDMREAEELSSTVILMKSGKVILESDPATIRHTAARTKGSTVRIEFRQQIDTDLIAPAPEVLAVTSSSPFVIEIRSQQIGTLINWLTHELGELINDISVRSPTLEEVFLEHVRG